MSENVKVLTSQNWESEVLKASGQVLVDFWAEWCAPCRMIAPSIEALASEFAGRATVGKLNEQQRYYLRTRGIGGQKAEQLLIWAFAAEVLAEVTQQPVREELERLVHARLDELTA